MIRRNQCASTLRAHDRRVGEQKERCRKLRASWKDEVLRVHALELVVGCC